MAAVTLFTVVVKEGGMAKLAEVLLIVVIGASISNVTCFTLWPSSATNRLQGSITTTLDSFNTLLSLLGATFLLEIPTGDATYASLGAAVKSHNDSFTRLKSDLAEAQHERIIDGRMSTEQRHRYSAVIDSLQKLAQHLTGMRSGTELQMELLQASQEGTITLDQRSHLSSSATTLKDEHSKRIAQRVRALEPDSQPLAQAGNLFFEYREAVADTMRELIVSSVPLTVSIRYADVDYDQALSASGLSLVKVAMTDYNSPDKHVQALIQNRTSLESTIEVFRNLSLDSVKQLFAGASDRRIEELFNEPSPLDRQEEVDRTGPIDAIYSIYL